MYTGYGIALDVGDSWSFGNDFARNVIIYGVDNSSSPHIDNCKNNFLVLMILMEILEHQRIQCW